MFFRTSFFGGICAVIRMDFSEGCESNLGEFFARSIAGYIYVPLYCGGAVVAKEFVLEIFREGFQTGGLFLPAHPVVLLLNHFVIRQLQVVPKLCSLIVELRFTLLAFYSPSWLTL